MGEPEPELKLATVRVFSGATARMDAELAKNLLQAEGIHCIVPGEIAAGTIPIFDVPLIVHEEDAARASTLLRDYFDSPRSPAEEESP